MVVAIVILGILGLMIASPTFRKVAFVLLSICGIAVAVFLIVIYRETQTFERERRASEAGGRMFRRSASAEGFLIELHELRAVQAVLPALQRQRVRALIVARLVFAAKGFTAWAILATTLYGLGSGVAWVRQGFAA